MAKIPKGRRGAAFSGTIVAIILGTALLLYFVFREHFASALVGVAGLVIGAASLLVGVIPLFERATPPKADDQRAAPKAGTVRAVNTGFVQGPQIAAGHDVLLEHDPHEYRRPEFPMTQMQRPSDSGLSTDDSAGQ